MVLGKCIIFDTTNKTTTDMTTIKTAAARVIQGDRIEGKIVSSNRMTESTRSRVIRFVDGSYITKREKTMIQVER